jgi:hypothetical protein
VTRLLLALGVMAVPALAQDKPLPPIQAFIKAADNGDTASMMAALGKDRLPKQIEGCYLRRVYSDPSGGVLAAWMCAEGDKASRVVIAVVGQSRDKAQLRIVQETRNAIPAPPRAGSALAPDPAPEAQQ